MDMGAIMQSMQDPAMQQMMQNPALQAAMQSMMQSPGMMDVRSRHSQGFVLGYRVCTPLSGCMIRRACDSSATLLKC